MGGPTIFALLWPKKSTDWRQRKYWGQFNLDRKDFSTFGDKQTGAYLLKFSWFPIVRHTLVKGRASPDDPRLADYWAKRQAAKTGDLTFSKQKLSSRQKGRCPQCFESLFNDEEIQIHHRVTWSGESKPSYSNLVLVHALCHQQIHAGTPRKMSDCQQHNDRKLPTDESPTMPQSKQESQQGSCCS